MVAMKNDVAKGTVYLWLKGPGFVDRGDEVAPGGADSETAPRRTDQSRPESFNEAEVWRPRKFPNESRGPFEFAQLQ